MSVVVIMGVAGSGKSTIGRCLSGRLHVPFLEGDDYHPPSNIKKMTDGVPLTDADRLPWIDAIAAAVNTGGAPVSILACSALTDSVRTHLKSGLTHPAYFVHLTGGQDAIRRRLENRTDHFFAPDLLESQFAALQRPEDAIEVRNEGTPDDVCTVIEDQLRKIPALSF